MYLKQLKPQLYCLDGTYQNEYLRVHTKQDLVFNFVELEFMGGCWHFLTVFANQTSKLDLTSRLENCGCDFIFGSALKLFFDIK